MNSTTTDLPYPATSTGTELLSKRFAPVRWAVPDILPEGVTILSGKAKLGKSWLALGLCVAVATGGYALGNKPVEQGESLYLALEDNERRLQDRLITLLTGSSAPDTLHLATEWPRFNDGGIGAVDAWLEDHPATRLVVVDTLKKVRPRTGGNRNIYDVDYEALEPLVPLAAEHNTAVLVVHHNNKMVDPDDPFDSISGSTGLTGGVDGVLILNRERGQADAFLYVDGRDIKDQGELPLKWDQQLCTWTLQDGEPIEHRMSDERRAIYDVLPDYGAEGVGPTAIADTTLMKADNVRYLLNRMVKDQQAESAGYGKYTKPLLTPNTTNTANGTNAPNGANTSEDAASVSGTDDGPNASWPQTPLVEPSVSGVSGVSEALKREALGEMDEDVPW